MIKVFFGWWKWTAEDVGRTVTRVLLFIGYAAINSSWVINSASSPTVTDGGFVAICGAYIIVITIPLVIYFHKKSIQRSMRGY